MGFDTMMIRAINDACFCNECMVWRISDCDTIWTCNIVGIGNVIAVMKEMKISFIWGSGGIISIIRKPRVSVGAC